MNKSKFTNRFKPKAKNEMSPENADTAKENDASAEQEVNNSENNELLKEIYALQEENKKLKDEVYKIRLAATEHKKLTDHAMETKQREMNRKIIKERSQVLKAMIETNESLLRAMVEKDNLESIVECINITQRSLSASLIANGVHRMEINIGDDFNPEIHNAISVAPHKEMADNQIVEILSTGYTIDGSVLMHANVVVVKNQQKK